MAQTKTVTSEQAIKLALEKGTDASTISSLLEKFSTDLDFAKAVASRKENTDAQTFVDLYNIYKPKISPRADAVVYEQKGGARTIRMIMAGNIKSMPTYVSDNLKNDPDVSIREVARKQDLAIKR